MSETMSEVSEIKTENPVVPLPSDSVDLETPQQERIENIFGMLIRVITTPTWVPKSFYEGFAVDTTNNRFYWYDFTNNVWKYTNASGSASITTFVPDCFTVKNTTAPIDSAACATNTEARLGLFNLPLGMIVNKITFRCQAITTEGTWDISVYTEDGQTQKFTVVTASIAGAGVNTVSLGTPVFLGPGNYWILMNSNGTANGSFLFKNFWAGGGNAGDYYIALASEPVYMGTLAITASTPPATFDPTAITKTTMCQLDVRFD
jgi:hypothetical protein